MAASNNIISLGWNKLILLGSRTWFCQKSTCNFGQISAAGLQIFCLNLLFYTIFVKVFEFSWNIGELNFRFCLNPLSLQMFLRINLGDWNIIEKYLRTTNLSGHSTEDNLLRLLGRIRVETHFPLKGTVFYIF